MHKSEIFLVLALSFLAGIFWGSFFQNFNQFFIYILLILAVIAAAIFYGNKIFLIIFFSLVTFFWGFHLVGAKLENISIQNSEGKEISEKVVVAKEPEIKEKYQNVVVKTKENLKILLNVNLYESLNYGDELDLKCQLKIPENKNEEFDYKMYLAKEGIFYLCQGAKIEKTGKNKGNKIYFAILSFKKRLENNISAVIPEPESALGKGLIFGGSSQLSKSQKDNFSRTGLSHIVAVSGFNVTIIASILMAIGIFLGLWRKQAFWFAIVGIFLFVLSIGFPSSAVRAGVMGSLLLWAMKNGRLANSKNAIIFSASVMLLINPLLLRWDIGFQLSFLATLGIIELSPFWENYLRKKHKAFGMLENVFLTLSASIFVLPIIIYNFQTLSVISLISNALVLPVVPFSMLLVFLTSICGLFLQSFSLPLAWVTFLPLKYIIEVVNYLGSLKWASVEINNFGVGWVILWYIMLFLTVYFAERKFKKFT